MKPPPLRRTAEITLALIRAAFGRDAGHVFDEVPDEEEWSRVYAFASRQGVLAIAFEGIASLPESLRPPKKMMLAWGVNARLTAERYDKQKHALARLARRYSRYGIRTLVLKGWGLSLCYPVPEERECGDIDIYLFGEFIRGNVIAGIPHALSGRTTSKHTSFICDGAPFENHRAIVDTSRKRRLAHLGSWLETLADKESRPRSVNGAEVWLPSATFNAVYLPAHAAAHFRGGRLPLRCLCDWARFLETQGRNIDRAAAERILKRSRLDRLAALMTSFAEEHLGVPPQGTPRPDERLKEKFARLVFGFGAANGDEGTVQRLKRVWGGRWRSREVLRESYIIQLCHTMRLRRTAGRDMDRGEVAK